MPPVTLKEGLTDTAVTSQQKFTLAWQEAAAVWDWEGKSQKGAGSVDYQGLPHSLIKLF